MFAPRVTVASVLVALATLAFFAPHAAAQGQGFVPSGGSSCGLARIIEGPATTTPAQPGIAVPARDLSVRSLPVRMLPARSPGWGPVTAGPVFTSNRRRTLR